ncbi:MAG: TetM/TetW/TetO/TetS family tetracycline resistance ribosomal protection protein [Oscillospiraceae bacterium]|nr:TetM/TetW/TetO/TetS family tetracycline resistance ribosomal protection protein [Oscillospiraceae bacterium]
MANTLNIGIVAHIDAGKTTLTEHILFESGVIRTKGRVDHASTVTDDLAIERRRGITIKEKTVSFNWGSIKINLLDTPGHADFLCEVVRAFHVLDIAVLVISAKESVQPQTVAIYNLLKKIGLPVVIFINKLDRAGADVERVRKDIAALGIKHAMMRFAGESLSVEHWSNNAGYAEDNLLTLLEFDDDIIAGFESGESGHMVDDIIYKFTAENKIVPVFIGVALQGIGVKDLLDELVRIQRHVRILPQDAPASAIIYKINFNERRERKIYFRMYAGTIRVREKYGVAQKPDDFPEIQIKTLETVSGAKLAAADHVSAGEIGVLTNVDDLRVGDIIGVRCDGIRTVDAVKPIFSADVFPVKRMDKQRLLDALAEMNLEDGQLDFTIDDKSQITIKLFGEIQKEFIRTQLQDKYGIETEFSNTRTIFKETPVGTGRSGPGFLEFTVEPLPRGTGVSYEYNRGVGITGGLTKQMHAAVQESALASLIPSALIVADRGEGVPFRPGAQGWEVVDIRVIFDACNMPGGPRPSAGAFRGEAPWALKQAIQNAGTQVLEPIYYYQIVVHADFCGKTVSEIENHRGNVVSIEDSGAYVKLSGKLPARMYQEFLREFQPLTKNMGSFDTIRVEYEPYSGE